mgnify:CR=1 FL=1
MIYKVVHVRPDTKERITCCEFDNLLNAYNWLIQAEQMCCEHDVSCFIGEYLIDVYKGGEK